MKFLFNDEMDWNTMWFPTHIIGIEGDALPISIGISKTFLQGYVGIYIKERYLNRINWKKPFILIHDPQPNMNDIKVDWRDFEDKKNNNVHLHIYKEE